MAVISIIYALLIIALSVESERVFSFRPSSLSLITALIKMTKLSMSVHRFFLFCFLLWNDSGRPPETLFVPGSVCGLSVFFFSLPFLLFSLPLLYADYVSLPSTLSLAPTVPHCLWFLFAGVGGGPINGANGNWPDDERLCSGSAGDAAAASKVNRARVLS